MSAPQNALTMLSDSRVLLNNVPRWLPWKQLHEYLVSLNPALPGYIKCRKAPNQSTAFLLFDSEENVQNAIQNLDKHAYKNTMWRASKAAAFDPRASAAARTSRKRDRPDAAGDAGTPLVPEGTEPTIMDRVTALWRLPYPQQLDWKERHLLRVAHGMRHSVMDSFRRSRRQFPDLSFLEQDRPGSREQEEGEEGRGTFVRGVKPSPVIDGYRNKVEFTFGINSRTGGLELGFNEGSFVEGQLSVASPLECVHIPPLSKQVQIALMAHYCAAGGLPHSHFDKTSGTGLWRSLVMRFNSKNEMLLLFCVNLGAVGSAEEARLMCMDAVGVLQAAVPAEQLAGAFMACWSGSGNGIPSGCTPVHLFGRTSIDETLSIHQQALRFNIQPLSFFQVNKAGAEVCYKTVCDLVLSGIKDGAKVLALDVCCGTGTIGLMLASQPQIAQVIGVDIVPEAVEDAKQNAAANGLAEKCEFFAGKAEAVLTTRFLSDRSRAYDQVVAVVDPPRSGLHSDVVQALRACLPIDRLVYVSCNQDALLENMKTLSGPPTKRFTNDAFVPRCLWGIDMFPHCKDVEAVVLFERDRSFSTDAFERRADVDGGETRKEDQEEQEDADSQEQGEEAAEAEQEGSDGAEKQIAV